MLPTFIIAGERRCGTTSLYHWMSAHPDIYMYPKTDVNYFTEDELISRKWFDGNVDGKRWELTHDVEGYRKLFENSKAQAIGHKGADLFFWQPAHARIKKFLPQAKFIIILRNPVKRAWSQYWNEVGKGREELSFEEAILMENERMKRSAFARFHLSYISRGYYDKTISVFLENFAKEHILFVVLEELLKDPREVLSKIYEFIEVDPNKGLELAGKQFNENWTTVPRTWTNFGLLKPFIATYTRLSNGIVVRYTKDAEKRRKARKYLWRPFRQSANNIPLSSDLYKRLYQVYDAHIGATESLLERRISVWRS